MFAWNCRGPIGCRISNTLLNEIVVCMGVCMCVCVCMCNTHRHIHIHIHIYKYIKIHIGTKIIMHLAFLRGVF